MTSDESRFLEISLAVCCGSDRAIDGCLRSAPLQYCCTIDIDPVGKISETHPTHPKHPYQPLSSNAPWHSSSAAWQLSVQVLTRFVPRLTGL